MENVLFINEVLGYEECAVNCLLVNPNVQNEFISIANSPFLKIWKISDMSLVNTVYVPNSIYLLCILPVSKGFILGNQKGQILRLNQSYELIQTAKPHSDCVTGISESEDHIITVSSDCQIKFLGKQSWVCQKQIALDYPISGCKLHNKKLYMASVKAFLLDIHSYEISKIGRFDSFEIFKGKVFGCSHDKGLTCLQDKSNSYVPCDFMMAYERSLIIFSEECIGIVNHTTYTQWKIKRFRSIPKGCVIRTGFYHGGKLSLASEEGKIFQISFDLDYNGFP